MLLYCGDKEEEMMENAYFSENPTPPLILLDLALREVRFRSRSCVLFSLLNAGVSRSFQNVVLCSFSFFSPIRPMSTKNKSRKRKQPEPKVKEEKKDEKEQVNDDQAAEAESQQAKKQKKKKKRKIRDDEVWFCSWVFASALLMVLEF
jgi:hypothetical protein